jgi:hypothetical protein
MRGTHYAVELGALVALGTTPRVLTLACAELAEVLCCLGDDILEELEGDAAKRFTCEC